MFNNIGGKIKLLAKVLCWAGIALFVVAGFGWLMIAAEEEKVSSAITGVMFMIFGPIFSWVSTFLLYGFGQLIENSDILVDMYSEPLNDNKSEENKEYKE